MTTSFEEYSGRFTNALQLCIETRIDSIACDDSGRLKIKFASPPKNDEKLELFLKLFEGRWDKKRTAFIIDSKTDYDWVSLTDFLLISRLTIGNIVKLAEIDEFARGVAEEMGVATGVCIVSGVDDVARTVFRAAESKKMSLRELAEKSGLTQVTLSKFKAGNDVRLSSLLKIAKALGLKLMVR